MPNVLAIGRIIAELWRFNGFLIWRRPSDSLKFNNSKFKRRIGLRESMCVILPNVGAIDLTFAGI